MKPLLIDGAWTTTPDGYKNINPSDTSDVIDVYAQAGRAKAQAMIGAAQRALSGWALSTPQRRHDILKAVGDEIFARKDEIGHFLSRDEGKTLAEGIAETGRAAHIFHFFAGKALRVTGDRLESVRPHVGIEVTREPVGVVGIITPWNFPITIPAWKIVLALCFGNTVVFEPAELVQGCAWILADILHRAEVPPSGDGAWIGCRPDDARRPAC